MKNFLRTCGRGFLALMLLIGADTMFSTARADDSPAKNLDVKNLKIDAAGAKNGLEKLPDNATTSVDDLQKTNKAQADKLSKMGFKSIERKGNHFTVETNGTATQGVGALFQSPKFEFDLDTTAKGLSMSGIKGMTLKSGSAATDVSDLNLTTDASGTPTNVAVKGSTDDGNGNTSNFDVKYDQAGTGATVKGSVTLSSLPKTPMKFDLKITPDANGNNKVKGTLDLGGGITIPIDQTFDSKGNKVP